MRVHPYRRSVAFPIGRVSDPFVVDLKSGGVFSFRERIRDAGKRKAGVAFLPSSRGRIAPRDFAGTVAAPS
ncbi:MAG: hypothetical protein N2C14_08365, partial [Planctomycetales bacterium]